MIPNLTDITSLLEKTQADNLSGIIEIISKQDNSIPWQIYVAGGKIQYASSKLGEQARINCLWRNNPLTSVLPPLETEDYSYAGLVNWCKSQTIESSYLEQLFAYFTQEALVQIISLGEIIVRFLPQAPLAEATLNLTWDELVNDAKLKLSQWEKRPQKIVSGFSRLHLSSEKAFKFYRWWKTLDKQTKLAKFLATKKLSFWVELLGKKPSCYEIANILESSLLQVCFRLEAIIEDGLVEVLAFQSDIVEETQSYSQSNSQKSTQVANRQTGVTTKASNAKENKPLIACIDDSKTVQKQLRMTLEAVGYEVISITEPSTALKTLRYQQPILILMDINMPEIDGYELCSMLRRARKLEKVPIVMLTGRDGLIDRMRAKIAGANNYITKPCNPNKLLKLITNLTSTMPHSVSTM